MSEKRSSGAFPPRTGVAPALEYEKITHSIEDLRSIPKDQLAAYAGICHAVNELNVMKRVFLASFHQEPSSPEVGMYLWVQNHTLLRVWSAKIFELSQFLKFEGRYNRTSDKELKDFGDSARERFRALGESPFYEMTKRLRHEVTNHTSLKAIRECLDFVGDQIECSAFLGPEIGNCLFPFGEEVVFGGTLARVWTEHRIKPETSLDIWFEWNQSANNWATEQQLRFINNFIGALPKKKETFSIPTEPPLFQTKKTGHIPLFTAQEQRM